MLTIRRPPLPLRTNDLGALAERIKTALAAGEAAKRKGLEHYRAAGAALREAKAKCGHGRWGEWLRVNVDLSERQAQRYMALAESDVTADLEAQWRSILGNAPARGKKDKRPGPNLDDDGSAD